MLMEYQTLVNLLKDVQDPSQTTRVGDQIDYRSQDPRFFAMLQQAIRDNRLSLDLQLTATILFSQILRKNSLGQNQSQQYMLNLLIEILLDEKANYRVKEAVSSNLTNILQQSTQQQFKAVLLKASQWLFLLPKAYDHNIAEYNEDSTMNQLKVVLLIYSCIINSNSHFSIVAEAFQSHLLEALVSLHFPSTVMGLDSTVKLTKLFKEILDKSKFQTTDYHTKFYKWMAKSQMLSDWIFKLYGLDAVLGQMCYINPQSPFDHQQVSQVKNIACNLHNHILIAIDHTKQMHDEQLTQRHCNQVIYILNTISAFYNKKPFSQDYYQFMTSLLGILSTLIKQQPKIMVDFCDKLIHMIALPLLAITQQEQQLFDDDPQEFNSLAEDCCDKQHFALLKTEAAKLLQAIVDQFKGMDQYIVQHAIIAVKVRLGLDPNFQNNVPHFMNIEQAFLVLSILSYKIGRFDNQLREIENILKVTTVLEKVTPVDLARLFQFLAYNYQEIYPDNRKGQEWVFLALKTTIQQSKNYPSLAYSALDFISNVISTYFSQQFALDYIQQCSLTTQEMQFKIFIKLLHKHHMNFSQEGLCRVLDSLLMAVLSDVDKYLKRQKSHTMQITQSLQIVKKIVEKQPLKIEKPSVRRKIWEYIEHIQQFKRINLDDEVLRIIIAFVKWEGISQEVLKFIPTIMANYKEECYSQTPYIIFINQIALRTTHPLEMLLPLLEGIKELIETVKEMPTSVTDKLALGSSLLVAQHIMVTYGQQFPAQVIQKIAEVALKIIPPSDQPQDKTQGILIARALNLLFICHMHCRDQRALKYLLLFQDAFIFRSHDLRVLTTCLNKQIFRQPDIVAVTEMINLLIKTIWYSHESSTVNIISKKNNSIRSPTKIRIKKVTDYQVSLKSMKHPFDSNLIPQLYLKNTLQTMKSNNLMLFQGIMRSLPSNHQNLLRQIMSKAVIDGSKRKIVHIGKIKVDPALHILPQSAPKRRLPDQQSSSEEENQQEASSQKYLKKKRKQQQSH